MERTVPFVLILANQASEESAPIDWLFGSDPAFVASPHCNPSQLRFSLAGEHFVWPSVIHPPQINNTTIYLPHSPDFQNKQLFYILLVPRQTTIKS